MSRFVGAKLVIWMWVFFGDGQNKARVRKMTLFTLRETFKDSTPLALIESWAEKQITAFRQANAQINHSDVVGTLSVEFDILNP